MDLCAAAPIGKPAAQSEQARRYDDDPMSLPRYCSVPAIFWRLFYAPMTILAGAAAADPPPNADPALAPWFRSLMQPGTGISCCSLADCRTTEYRAAGDHYEALVGEAWLAVPPDRILQRTDNPTGRAVVCWTPQRGILCFVRSTEF